MKTYDHLTPEEKSRIIALGGKEKRYGLSDDELIEYYELIIKANHEPINHETTIPI